MLFYDDWRSYLQSSSSNRLDVTSYHRRGPVVCGSTRILGQTGGSVTLDWLTALRCMHTTAADPLSLRAGSKNLRHTWSSFKGGRVDRLGTFKKNYNTEG